jgi:hypothetical protein
MRAEHGQTVHIPSRSRRPVRIVTISVAAGLIVTAGASSLSEAAPTRVNVGDVRRMESSPIVIGTGPNAVYVGPAPTFGGDPARGETDDSYFARTAHHLPGRSSAAVVDGPWWHGQAPVTGGDPASGETDESYYARTGRHLPAGW